MARRKHTRSAKYREKQMSNSVSATAPRVLPATVISSLTISAPVIRQPGREQRHVADAPRNQGGQRPPVQDEGARRNGMPGRPIQDAPSLTVRRRIDGNAASPRSIANMAAD
jgi:hypothetical protein